jgi:hypothetical protein
MLDEHDRMRYVRGLGGARLMPVPALMQPSRAVRDAGLAACRQALAASAERREQGRNAGHPGKALPGSQDRAPSTMRPTIERARSDGAQPEPEVQPGRPGRPGQAEGLTILPADRGTSRSEDRSEVLGGGPVKTSCRSSPTTPPSVSNTCTVRRTKTDFGGSDD